MTLAAPLESLASDPTTADRFARCAELVGRDLRFPDLDFAAALDGSTSAKRDGQWLANCSVPQRAAELMIRKEAWPNRSLCVVAPTHGQQLAAVLHKLGPTRALIAIVPDAAELADMLASVDLFEFLRSRRLHVAWDEPSLRAVFAKHPGLAVPTQMAKLPDADLGVVKTVIAWAQPVLASITIDHARRLADAARRPAGQGRLVLAGRRFALWNDAGDTLARALADTHDVFDTDRPTHASEAVVAEAVAVAATIVADRPRPAWASADRAWITWLIRPTVPAFDPAHSRDGLIVADAAWRSLATAAGWPADRVAVAAVPSTTLENNGDSPASSPALLLDLPSLSTPADIDDSTALRLVWEAIRDELTRDPFAVGGDATAYVARAPARLGLPADPDFPVDRFVTKLVAPAFAVGVARKLAKAGVSFSIHGHGWSDETTLKDHIWGPITNADALRHAASGGVIDVSLPNSLPAIDACGVPVVRVFGRTLQRVTQDIAALAAGRLPITPCKAPPLGPEVVAELSR